MVKCKKCGQVMIKLAYYDPDGEFPLKWIMVNGVEWACMNIICQREKK